MCEGLRVYFRAQEPPKENQFYRRPFVCRDVSEETTFITSTDRMSQYTAAANITGPMETCFIHFSDDQSTTSP